MAENFTTTITVDQSPKEVFAAIQNTRAWWSGEYEGTTDQLNAEFTYRYKDFHYSKQKVAELVPDSKVVWHVIEANLRFAKDPHEWVGTDIVFDITEQGEKTLLTFTHVGLVPTLACYGACSGGWKAFIEGNLKNFITTGEVQPNPFEK